MNAKLVAVLEYDDGQRVSDEMELTNGVIVDMDVVSCSEGCEEISDVERHALLKKMQRIRARNYCTAQMSATFSTWS
ncbi:MAG: hypothetical protein EOP82_02230 [Variovorax sp.]|nr:MAG: hypothetical protein EOP82_02230 [Variovorax sp.]